MSAYEIWIFSTDGAAFPGGLVAVEDVPESYGLLDAQQLANLRALDGGPGITTLVRGPGCY